MTRPAGLHIGQGDRMLPDRERFGERGGARIQPLGHRHQHRLLQHHQLPEAAGQRRGKSDDLQAGGSIA